MATHSSSLVEPISLGWQNSSRAIESPRIRLFQISFLILFFELACIRWFGSTVVFLTFFTNIVLIACFLGMSVGCLAAKRETNFIRWALPLAALASLLAAVVFMLHVNRPDLIFVDVGNQKSPAAIYFGAEYGNPDIARAVIPIEVIAGTFFVMITFIFVGLGQEMGRAFNQIPDRLSAYTVDIVGSLTGIVAFAVMSYAWMPPVIWFAISAVMMAYIARDWGREQTISVVLLLCIAGGASAVSTQMTIWSPYYKIKFDPRTHGIDTNNIGHQQMHDLKMNSWVYHFVHRLTHDSGSAPFDDMMIIGAGSGNDVTAGLMAGAKRIDAVEIDPAINYLGKTYHPNQPYSDPRLNYVEKQADGGEVLRQSIFYEDGRQWLKKNIEGVRQNKHPHHLYDLAVYALVDSLVLHSSHSGSLRLESFLFTEEAFQDVRANLKPGGVFAMYNYYRQPWVIGRIDELARRVFGVEPLVFSMPAQDRITDGDGSGSHITFVLVGLPDAGKGTNARLEAIRAKFKQNPAYYLATSPEVATRIDGFGAKEPAIPAGIPPEGVASANANQFFRFVPAAVEVKNTGPLPTDDWPQLYLKDRQISPEVWKSMVFMGGLAALILFAFMPKGGARRPNWIMFFLGAGFMLLETKGVVHMSLLFGSTWVTNSVVFFSILTMVLLANAFVMLVKPSRLWPYYVLLLAALVANVIVPMNWYLTLPDVQKTIVSCAVIFLPVFFAGVVFATLFSRSENPDVDFGWNIAGVILGALAENFSMMFGFNALIYLAIAFYLFSLAARRFGRGSMAAA